jgi:small neutral amino acid transporter SnatA (MarC family)
LHLSPIALRIGGAVILLMIAIRMIFPHPDGVLGKSEGGEPFIVPLAIPALAGPSALATVLLLSATSFTETMVHVAALAAVGIVWLAVFLSAEKLQQKLGPQVMTAFERLMGLILTAMAVEMLLGGIREFVRTL